MRKKHLEQNHGFYFQVVFYCLWTRRFVGSNQPGFELSNQIAAASFFLVRRPFTRSLCVLSGVQIPPPPPFPSMSMESLPSAANFARFTSEYEYCTLVFELVYLLVPSLVPARWHRIAYPQVFYSVFVLNPSLFRLCQPIPLASLTVSYTWFYSPCSEQAVVTMWWSQVSTI